MKKTASILLFLVLLCNSAVLLAQDDPESLVPETDKFEDYFYESLKQKGVENYDLAIIELERCLKLKPNDATVYSELGKNYLALKKYEQSYKSFEKAAQIDPKNKWFWAGMYEVNYQTKNYNQAIVTINKLIEFNEYYKEDLVSLYMYTQQFENALSLIEELNEKVGKSDRRELYKTQILSQGKYQNIEKDNLITQIRLNPKVESNYVALISWYSENNETEKAADIAKKLSVQIPDSDWAQIGLLAFYLNKNENQKAEEALNVVLASTTIEAKMKYSVLREFLIYVDKNPQNIIDLEPVTTYLEKNPEVNLTKEIAKQFYKRKQWDNAIQFYELSLKNNLKPDVETNLLLLQTYVEAKQFELVAKKVALLVQIFPTQPQFYYFSGLANNQIKDYKKASIMLDLGLDFVVEDVILEADFNLQLAEAFNGLGDLKKKEQYFARANQLIKQKK